MKKTFVITLSSRVFYLTKLLLLAFVCLHSRTSAQSIEFLRQSTKSGSGTTISGLATAVDATGNVYVAGYFQGSETFGSTTLVSAGSFDIYIAKYDASGTFQWARRAGGNSEDAAYGIAVSGSSVYITGSFLRTADFNTPSASGSNEIVSATNNLDIFVAKFDENGTFQWAKRAGGANAERGRAIAVNGSSVYISGYFQGTANFNTPSATGTNEIVSAGSNDIFIAKYDDTGTFQWARRAGSGSSEESYGIAVSGNAIYLTGYFDGTINFNTPSAAGSNEISTAGTGDIFIAKYDNTGTFQWAKRAGGTNSDIGSAIAVSGTSIYITGNFRETINFNTPSVVGSNELISAGLLDIFIAKYDDTGTFLWAKRGGGISADTGNGIAIFGNDVFISGGFDATANFNTPSAIGSNEITSAGSHDIFIAKYDNLGNFQSAKRAGGIGYDNGAAVAMSATSVYLCGYFTNTANFNTPSSFGSNELVAGTANEVFIAKYNINTLPTFTNQPSNTTICESANASISLVAADAISYQWQIFNGSIYVDLTNISPYSNVTSPTLTITSPSNSLNGTIYRCVATGTFGSSNSNSITLAINTNVITETAAIVGGTVTKNAGQNLTASNIISESANVSYSAGKFVLMNAGFQVQSGSVFSAIIQNNCVN